MVNKLSESEARVVAMAIDTDGNIGINHYYSHGCPGYISHVDFANTSPKLVEAVRDTIDGNSNISRYSLQKQNPNCKDKYSVRWSAHGDVFAILAQIQPYLIRKREVADVAMEFCRVRMKKLEKSYHASFGEEEQVLYELARELNMKGYPGTTK
jgi:hypothetical protein